MKADSGRRHRLRQIINAAAVEPIEGYRPSNPIAVIWAYRCRQQTMFWMGMVPL
jgi:hypothetical protein